MAHQVPDNVVETAAAALEVHHLTLENVEYRYLAPRTDVLRLGITARVPKATPDWHQWGHTPVDSDVVHSRNMEAYISAAYGFIGTEHETDDLSKARTRMNAILLGSARAGIMNFFTWDTRVLKPKEMYATGLKVVGPVVRLDRMIAGASGRFGVARSMAPMTFIEKHIATHVMQFGVAAVMSAAIARRATAKYMPNVLKQSADDLIKQLYHHMGPIAASEIQETHGPWDISRLLLTNAIHAVDLDMIWAMMVVSPQTACLSQTIPDEDPDSDWEEASYRADWEQFHTATEEDV